MPESALSASGLHRARALIARVPRSLMLFVVVGLIGLGVHTALFSVLFHQAGLPKPAAWLSALLVATAATWVLNRRFTFSASGPASVCRSGGQVARYAAVTAVAQGISFGVFMALGRAWPALPAQLALIAGAVVATAFSYTGQRFFTFRVYGSGRIEVIAVGDTPLLVAAPTAEPTV